MTLLILIWMASWTAAQCIDHVLMRRTVNVALLTVAVVMYLVNTGRLHT